MAQSNVKNTKKNASVEQLRTWLLSMGATHTLLQPAVLAPVTIGNLAILWREVALQVHPADHCDTIRDNIFLAAVHENNKTKHSHCPQLTLIKRKDQLTQQRQSLLDAYEQSRQRLTSVLENTRKNKIKLEKARQELSNIRRKRAVFAELQKQLKVDIDHSEEVAKLLKIFTDESTPAPLDEDRIRCVLKSLKDKKVNAKELLDDVHIDELWKTLISKREGDADSLMAMASSVDLQSELATVELNAIERSRAKPWRDGLADLNLIYADIVFSTLECDRAIGVLNSERKKSLKMKFDNKNLDEAQRELFRSRLKLYGLETTVNSRERFIEDLRNSEGIFSMYVSKRESDVDISEVRREIESVERLSEDAKKTIERNLFEMTEAIPRMKIHRSKTLEVLGRNDRNSRRLTDLFESVLNSSIGRTLSSDESLSEIKERMTDLNILNCINTQYDTLAEEMRSMKEYPLELNRKIIFEDGSVEWFANTDAGRQIPSDETINSLILPWETTRLAVKKYAAMKYWKNEMSKFKNNLRNSIEITKGNGNGAKTPLADDEKSLDAVEKKIEDILNSLCKIRETCDHIDSKVEFFNEVKWKSLISKDKTLNGKLYVEYEEEMKNIIRNMNS